MTPNTKIEHLGFINDSEKMTVSLTPEKVEKLTTLCETCVNKEGFIISFTNFGHFRILS